MNTKLLSVLLHLRRGTIAVFDAHDQILSLLDENGVGVSDSSAKHGALPHVRKSECEAVEIDTSIGESEQITLGNRIDSESELCHCQPCDDKWRCTMTKH